MSHQRENPMPTHDEISAKAKELWEKAGEPQGRDEEFWLRAELMLEAKPVEVKKGKGGGRAKK